MDRKNRFTSALALVTCLTLFSCSSVFTIKPKNELPPLVAAGAAAVSQLEIEATALTTDAEVIDTFEGNLLLAGVVPVRVEVRNLRESALSLSSARFVLATSEGDHFKPLSPKKTFERLIEYYDVGAYSRGAYANTLEGFESLALDLRTPLEAKESRQGFLYFEAPPDAQPRLASLEVTDPRRANGQQPFALRVNLVGKEQASPAKN